MLQSGDATLTPEEIEKLKQEIQRCAALPWPSTIAPPSSPCPTLTLTLMPPPQLPTSSEYLAAFQKTVAMHEVFLMRLVSHPTFREDDNLQAFLEYEKDVSTRLAYRRPDRSLNFHMLIISSCLSLIFSCTCAVNLVARKSPAFSSRPPRALTTRSPPSG